MENVRAVKESLAAAGDVGSFVSAAQATTDTK